MFDKAKLKIAINYLLDNCYYFTVENSTFKQLIGITMGSHPAPFMATPFLYYFEKKLISNLKRSNMHKTR